MAQHSNAPTFGKDQNFFLNLYQDVAWDLHVYCEVISSQKTKVINRAVRELMQRDLEENQGFRSRFEEMKVALETDRRAKAERHAGPLRVLESPKTRKARGTVKRRSKERD